MRHLVDLGSSLGLAVTEAALPMQGRARVIVGQSSDRCLGQPVPATST